MKINKIPAKTIKMYGVFRKFNIFGEKCRELILTANEFEAAKMEIDDIINNDKFKLHKPNDFMIEPVTVRISAWAPDNV